MQSGSLIMGETNANYDMVVVIDCIAIQGYLRA
jgi:hypothetical protein